MERKLIKSDKEDVQYGEHLRPVEYAKLKGVTPERIHQIKHKLDCYELLGTTYILHTMRNDKFFDNPSPRRGKGIK